MSNFGEFKNSRHFMAVDVNLDDFYQDHRSKARIFVNDKIDCVKQFERRIAEVFNVSDFYLTCNDHYLPPSEDIRIIKAGEVVRVVALKQETRHKHRKRDKECVLPIEIEDDNNGSETAVAVKKRKKDKNRENHQSPPNLEELNDLPLDEGADHCDDTEKTKNKKKKKRKHSKDVEAEEPKTKKMKADKLIADDVQVASKKKLRKSGINDSENSELDKQLAKTKDSVADFNEQGECSVKKKKKKKCRETSEHVNEEDPIETISPSAKTVNNSLDQYMEVPINTDLPQRKVNIVKTIIVSSGTVIDTSISQIQQNKEKSIESNDNAAARQSTVEIELVPGKFDNLNAEDCGSLAKRKRNRTRKRKQKNFGRCPPPTPPAVSGKVMLPSHVVRPMIGPVRPEGRHIKFTEDDNIQEISSESGHSESGSRTTAQFQRNQDEATEGSEIMTKAVKNEMLEQSQLDLQNNGCTALVVDNPECNGDKQNGIVDAAVDVDSQNSKSESLSAADAKIQFDKAESDMEIDSIVADIHKFNRTADEMDKAVVPKGSVAGGQPVSAEESTSTRTNGHVNVNRTDTVAENTAKNGNPKEAGVRLGISNNFPEITEELISKSPLSSNYVPGVTDLIAFKILRISEQYTPEVSSYIAGQIVNYDASREVITLNISYGFDQCTPPQGKFSIAKEDPTSSTKDKTVEFTWPELLEIRRLSPRC